MNDFLQIVRKILSNFQSFQIDTKIDLSGENNGNEKINLLAKLINYLHSIKVLDLKANNITYHGAEGISLLYQNYRSKLSKLLIDRNPLNKKGISIISEAMINQQSYLKKLSMQGCNNEPLGLISLINCIDKLKMLEELDISLNYLGDVEIKKLADQFISLENLKYLNLGDNIITHIGIKHIILSLNKLKYNKILILNLANNHFGSKGFKEISNIFFQTPKFGSLLLEGNDGNDEGITFFFQNLKEYESTAKHPFIIDLINIDSNGFTDKAANFILEYYKMLKKENRSSGIAKLSFNFNNVSDNCLYKLKFKIENVNKVDFIKADRDKKSNLQQCITVLFQDFIRASQKLSIDDIKFEKKIEYINGRKSKITLFSNINKEDLSIDYLSNLYYTKIFLIEKLKEYGLSNELFLNNEIGYFPKIKSGDKFFPIKMLEKLNSSKEYEIFSVHEQISVLLFLQNTPYSKEILHNLKILWEIQKETIKINVIFKIIVFGDKSSLLEINECFNTDPFFECYVIDNFKYKEAFLYNILYDFNEKSLPYTIIINSFGRVIYKHALIIYKFLKIFIYFIHFLFFNGNINFNF